MHFTLVLAILACNIGFLFYTFFYSFNEKTYDCEETWQKVFFVLDLFTYFWDVLEFILQLLMLLIVLKYTTREESSSANKSENSNSGGVSSSSGHARESKNVKERYNEHARNMGQWELDALNKRQHRTNLDERIGRSFYSMSSHGPGRNETADDLLDAYLDPSEDEQVDVLLAQTLEDFYKSCQ